MTESSRFVGFTGHQGITTKTHQLIADVIRDTLQHETTPIGITSLAAGSDQIFAQVVLELGGNILVVLPAKRYEESFEHDDDLSHFRSLLGVADEVVAMPFEEPSEEAYWAAGKEIVDRAQYLLAVWDGRPAGGLGGTADVVQYARAQGKPVVIVWPEGSDRS